MSTEIQTSPDIFFQVKKQILDKLDIILQKINLQIINQHHSLGRSTLSHKNFTFIQLSEFEQEISGFFRYLDKLYESMNSSLSGEQSMVMFHTNKTDNTFDKKQIQIQTLKDKCQQISDENINLRQKMEKLIIKSEGMLKQSSRKFQKLQQKSAYKLELSGTSKSQSSLIITDRKIPFQYIAGSQTSKNTGSQIDPQQYQRKQIHKQNILAKVSILSELIKQQKRQFNEFQNWVRKKVKQQKFILIENRIQIISMMRQQNNLMTPPLKSLTSDCCQSKTTYLQKSNSNNLHDNQQCQQCYSTSNQKDYTKILYELNDILGICRQ